MASGGISVSIGEASPLGVTVREDGINLAVLSRHADQVSVCLFDDAGDRELARLVLPGRTGTDIHHGSSPACGAAPAMACASRERSTRLVVTASIPPSCSSIPMPGGSTGRSSGIPTLQPRDRRP